MRKTTNRESGSRQRRKRQTVASENCEIPTPSFDHILRNLASHALSSFDCASASKSLNLDSHEILPCGADADGDDHDGEVEFVGENERPSTAYSFTNCITLGDVVRSQMKCAEPSGGKLGQPLHHSPRILRRSQPSPSHPACFTFAGHLPDQEVVDITADEHNNAVRRVASPPSHTPIAESPSLHVALPSTRRFTRFRNVSQTLNDNDDGDMDEEDGTVLLDDDDGDDPPTKRSRRGRRNPQHAAPPPPLNTSPSRVVIPRTAGYSIPPTFGSTSFYRSGASGFGRRVFNRPFDASVGSVPMTSQYHSSSSYMPLHYRAEPPLVRNPNISSSTLFHPTYRNADATSDRNASGAASNGLEEEAVPFCKNCVSEFPKILRSLDRLDSRIEDVISIMKSATRMKTEAERKKTLANALDAFRRDEDCK